MDASGELPCVGRLEIAQPKPVGFLCGTLPVIADDAFSLLPRSSLVPSTQTIQAPRYQMLPRETDLNTLPLLPDIPEKVISAACSSNGDSHFESGPLSPNLSRKCEALAVAGVAEYGDEIDIVAPTDILKQIFKIPYSKARLSVAVHRIGDTLILNTGPDVEEGDKMFRRQSNQHRGADFSIFQNFAMHSVRAEACDCPPGYYASSDKQSSSTMLPGHYGHMDGTSRSATTGLHSKKSQFIDPMASGSQKDRVRSCADYSKKAEDNVFWDTKKKKNIRRRDAVSKSSQVGEKPRGPVQESEKSRRVGNNGFLRVLFWQFHNFRMLLGSDLLLFSNEKYVAVSLHLWDVARQVTPLTWLEAWLDNVMASVQELAICYHQNGVIQGYELLKTDDIFLLKGISEDGTPAFHPQVVQQNGLSVLRFLQDNCKQDPGAYWLYKNAGDDAIQLFDLSVLPKNNSTVVDDKACSSLPSLMHKGRRESLFSLGTLLYRIAHRLSLSKAPDSKAKCANFFMKCLDFLSEQDHLVVRASAHEQFARLILKCYQELDLTSESYLLESEVTVTDMEDESSIFSVEMFGSVAHDKDYHQESEDMHLTEELALQSPSEELEISNLEENLYVPRNIRSEPAVVPSVEIVPNTNEKTELGTTVKDGLAVSHFSERVPQIQTVVDPISSKLAAIHHVSQAIKSLRWNRQLQNAEVDILEHGNGRGQDRFLHANLSVCACGDADCIEVCDIREWLAKSKMDQKLWKLVLLLGESYLALGEAYKDDGQLHQALKIVEIACSVYGSMPQDLEGAQFISSMVNCSSFHDKFESKSGFLVDDAEAMSYSSADERFPMEQFSSNNIFWAKTWTLVGDVFVEYHRVRDKDASLQESEVKSRKELRMSNEVVSEVIRLKKKLGRFKQNCSICSLINCSCQSDRVSSGSSASSSSGNTHASYGRKHSRKVITRNSNQSSGLEDSKVLDQVENMKGFGGVDLHNSGNGDENMHSSFNPDPDKVGPSCIVHNEEVGVDVQLGSVEASGSEPTDEQSSRGKHGGIFKFLSGPRIRDVEHNLSVAVHCYDMARKVISMCSAECEELQASIVKKKGWVANELGRCRLNNKDVRNAELAFKDAIKAFKEVSDHTNIILINCNMAHGRRALAEELVSKMKKLKSNDVSQNAYKLSMKRAKLEYTESIRYYKDAKRELNIAGDGVDLLLRNELCTQYAHTYLRLGMLLAEEGPSEEISENECQEQVSVGQLHLSLPNERVKERRISKLSAGDAFREALTIYESLGELRKQEAAFAHYQLACYHRSSCMRFLDLDLKQVKPLKCENGNRQKAKWYASLAERNWQKAISFYGPKTHSVMFLTILLELSTLLLNISNYLHSHTLLESALSHLLEGRHVTGGNSEEDRCNIDIETKEKFWGHLQTLLKKMLAVALSASSSKSGLGGSQAVIQSRAEDAGKLKEMYRLSLKSNSLSQLHTMHKLWSSFRSSD